MAKEVGCAESEPMGEASGGDGEAAAESWGPPEIGAPHLLQKSEPAGTSLPQLEQPAGIGAPHLLQNSESAGTSLPQLEQLLLSPGALPCAVMPNASFMSGSSAIGFLH